MAASSGDAAGNIIQILANLPDFLRKPMLQNRLTEFFAMSEDDRQETIRMALAAAPTVEPSKLAILVKSWLEVLCELDPERRMAMFRVYSQQVLSKPGSVPKLNFESLTASFMSLEEKQREKIIDSLHEVLFAIPNRNEILKLIPEGLKRSLKLI